MVNLPVTDMIRTELSQDVYNFLQTYLPEKKYTIRYSVYWTEKNARNGCNGEF